MVEPFTLNTCESRKSNQNMSDYMTELRRRSEHCNYVEKLVEQLRYRLVCGVKDNII